MKLQSRAFNQGAAIDEQFTADGDDISPPLDWDQVPAATQSLALVCDDPDAPSPRRPAPEPWVHWVLFNIPPGVTDLPPGVSRQPEPSELPGARQGVNSWPSDNIGYRGPTPPPGSGPHRYFFKLYALDTTLDLEAGTSKARLLEAMQGHLLEACHLVGTYER